MTPEQQSAERAKWRNVKRERPEGIPIPGPGQESVWDYPRPPRVERVAARVRVELAGIALADTTRALRVCETSSPPAYYVPPGDVARAHLEPAAETAFCEWKGLAHCWTARAGGREVREAAWSYPQPDPEYTELRDHLAFHAGRVDACWVGGDRVEPQPGTYYGGWITPNLVGPFKGGPGSERW